jgi:two-component system, NarL family, nitrate/nitrite response regulator NarL
MKVLIVDDHPLFRAGFHAVLAQSPLEAEILSVATLAEAQQLLRDDADIGLVLLDLHLRDSDGFVALRSIGEHFPTTACIMISGDEHEGLAQQAVAAGASGFIPKSFTADQMLAAINEVLAGNVSVPEQTPMSIPVPRGTLTLRQLEVVTMLARGCSNKQIARELDLAERTVKAHVTALFDVLQAKNRTQAVILAQQQGYLPANIMPFIDSGHEPAALQG